MTNNEQLEKALKWALENPPRSDNALEILNANSGSSDDSDLDIKDSGENLKALEHNRPKKE